MRLASETFRGDAREAVAWINENVLARFLLTLQQISPTNTTIVFRFGDYPSYTWFCKRMGRKPLSTERYFGEGVGASYDTSAPVKATDRAKANG